MLVLSKKKEEVTGFEIKIHGEKAESFPQKFIKIEMEYIFTGHNLDPKKVERAVDLSSNKYCSVKGSLDPAIEFVVTTTIKEA
jgi:putative redox protein